MLQTLYVKPVLVKGVLSEDVGKVKEDMSQFEMIAEKVHINRIGLWTQG